jgi:hypothetical protein
VDFSASESDYAKVHGFNEVVAAESDSWWIGHRCALVEMKKNEVVMRSPDFGIHYVSRDQAGENGWSGMTGGQELPAFGNSRAF